MPIFEYRCQDCGHEFETLVRGGADAPTCPKCHSVQLHKKLSAPAAVGGSSGADADLPEACRSCGHPGGPGSCGMM